MKKDENVSESEDTSCESSGPQTPSSIKDFSSSFPPQDFGHHLQFARRESSPSAITINFKDEIEERGSRRSSGAQT